MCNGWCQVRAAALLLRHCSCCRVEGCCYCCQESCNKYLGLFQTHMLR
jgi:hypothetical protein